MIPDTNIWAIEHGFARSWPALTQHVTKGWTLKIGGGLSRRTNSANPSTDSQSLGGVLPEIEEFYSQQQLPALVRLLSTQDSHFEQALSERGYVQEGETRTLWMPRLDVSDLQRSTIELKPTAAWVDGVTSAQQRAENQRDVYRKHLTKINIPVAFASTHDREEDAVSWAYAALHGSVIYIESVATRQDRRGQGYGQNTLGALINWGRTQGAVAAALQVQADNSPAIRLYERVGFSEELYRYCYWRSPTGV